MIFSLFLAFILMTVPVPDWFGIVEPNWLALVILYWQVIQTNRLPLSVCWGLGLLLDILQGGPLGINAMAMVILAYCAARLARQMLCYPTFQQMCCCMLLLLLVEASVAFLHQCLGDIISLKAFWLPAVSGALLWPWYFDLMHFRRKRSRQTAWG